MYRLKVETRHPMGILGQVDTFQVGGGNIRYKGAYSRKTKMTSMPASLADIPHIAGPRT